jgi:DNA-binding transcriptional ArsR family regulator
MLNTSYRAAESIARETTQPTYPDVDLRSIPRALRERDQWVAWRWAMRDGAWTKVPVNPRTGHNAKTNDPETWGSFDDTIDYAAQHGIGNGYIFHESDPFVGIDFDDCRDAATGEIHPDVLATIRALDSYTDISPSDTGLKVIIRGKKPGDRCLVRGGKIEVYETKRLFTLTGRNQPGTPATIEPAQNALETLYGALFPPVESAVVQARRNTPNLNLDDHEVIARAMRSKVGDAVRRLWEGDTSLHDGNDSSADLALCNHLRFFTGGDPVQMDRLFRQSGLMRPKWDKPARAGETYGEGTIKRALPGDVYEPSQPASMIFGDMTTVVVTEAMRDFPSGPSGCVVELARIAELEQENARLKAQVGALLNQVASLQGHHSLTERVHNNPGLTPAIGQIATNVIAEVASKVEAGQHEDGWVLIRLDRIVRTADAVDPETGEIVSRRIVSKQTASRYIDRLAEADALEVREQSRYDGRSPITDKYVRLLGEKSATLDLLSTVVLEKPKQGGSKKGHRRCKKHPTAGLHISRVTRCAECRDILDEHIVEHVPPVRFHHGTVEPTAAPVVVSPRDVKMEPSLDEAPATPFQHETDAAILDRRQALRAPRPASRFQHETAPKMSPVPLDERIVQAVTAATAKMQPLHEDEVARIVGAQPRDVRPVMQSLVGHRLVKRWDDGYVTVLGAD